MRILFYFLVLIYVCLPVSFVQSQNPSRSKENTINECVILLHGLARTSDSFSSMKEAIEKQGYVVVNYDYPSTEEVIEMLAPAAIENALSQCPKDYKIDFVTHSMGGILVRQYLRYNTIENLNRTVMLGPPNKGSAVVDHLKSYPGFSMINGPAGYQLGTEASSTPNSLGPVSFELGVIAGSQSVNLILSQFLSNPDDGKVSVESTKVEGMKDHIVLHVTHTFMMYDEDVIAQTLHFLQEGKFYSSEL